MENLESINTGSHSEVRLENSSQVVKARRLLAWSGTAWLGVLVLCQFIFVVYLIAAYANPAISGNVEAWSSNAGGAFIEGQTLGNVAFGMHVLLAIIMIIGGPLQLIPAIRNKYRAFHRFNGRTYVLLALTISLVGIYIMWTRGTVGDLTMHALTTFNGVVTIVCGVMAFIHAKNRNIATHQVWATRLFIAANGVLYFRIILFGFLVLFGPLGIDFATFTGPTVIIISLCCYVLPILLYEAYRRAKSSNNVLAMYGMAVLMIAITLYFMLGTFAVTMGNWLPVIQ